MKPKPKIRKVLDYRECTEFVEKKYNIKTGDYAGRYSEKRSIEELNAIPYQDFWHWICDACGVSNGGTITLSSELEWAIKEPWQKEILDLYVKEFGDGAEYETNW